ncbi:MAG: hypothetical protein KAJ86_07330 [Alphaproteobacteria bacterium]|nr:hypothetical protein [Alphaproteobacteria bacterium]
MNEMPPENENTNHAPVGNLTDFVEGIDETNRLDIEVAIKEDGHVIVFHSHRFKSDISWFEFDLGENKLDFVLEDGDLRDIGLPLTNDVAKHMQNSHQILTILMDPKTGEATEGRYVPLIIHRK